MFYSICSGTPRLTEMDRESQLLCTREYRHHTQSRDSVLWKDQEKSQGRNSRKILLTLQKDGLEFLQGQERTGLREWIGEDLDCMRKNKEKEKKREEIMGESWVMRQQRERESKSTGEMEMNKGGATVRLTAREEEKD